MTENRARSNSPQKKAIQNRLSRCWIALPFARLSRGQGSARRALPVDAVAMQRRERFVEAIDQLEEGHEIFGGDIETAPVEHSGTRRKSALRHTLDAGDAGGLRAHLKQHPKLVHEHVLFEGGNYFRDPTLLEFVAENPVRHGKLPGNIVEVAKVIVDAGADRAALNETLGLVATGMVPRRCRVQVPLIDLLCAHGADPHGALLAAALHGEFEAVEALLKCGGKVDLPIAAALGQTEEARRLLPTADTNARHRALTGGAMFGHVEIVRMLLDAGEDLDRYNSIGAHSHSTPLHQAALAGHENVVRLLVERGARLDIKDILWQGTPADWARHGGKTDVERYLREAEKNRSA